MRSSLIQQPTQRLTFAPVPGDRVSEPPCLESHPEHPGLTPESIAHAKAVQQMERAGIEAQTGCVFVGDRLVNPWRGDGAVEVSLEVALRIGNAIAAACYGSRGQWH